MARIDKLLCQPGEKSFEQREEATKACENYTRRFPVLFKRNMTRKMHVFSIVLPKFIREKGDYFKYLKLEQNGESRHHLLNELEVTHACLKNQSERYFLMLKALENKWKCDPEMFRKKRRTRRCM